MTTQKAIPTPEQEGIDMKSPQFKLGGLYSFEHGGSIRKFKQPVLDPPDNEYEDVTEGKFWTVLEIGEPHEHAPTWRWMRILLNDKIFWTAMPYEEVYVRGLIEYSEDRNKINPRGAKVPQEILVEEEEIFEQIRKNNEEANKK